MGGAPGALHARLFRGPGRCRGARPPPAGAPERGGGPDAPVPGPAQRAGSRPRGVFYLGRALRQLSPRGCVGAPGRSRGPGLELPPLPLHRTGRRAARSRAACFSARRRGAGEGPGRATPSPERPRPGPEPGAPSRPPITGAGAAATAAPAAALLCL